MKNKKLLVCEDCHQTVRLEIYLDPNEIGDNNPIKEYIIENKPFKLEEVKENIGLMAITTLMGN